MRLKNFREVPPDGYRYVHPETGHLTRAWDENTWFAEAKKHLIGNNLPVPHDLEAQMEDQLCATLPPEWCDQVDPNRPYISLRMNWSDVKRGVDTYAAWIAGGMQTVDQTESNRRAKICVGCYANTVVEGCNACHKAASMLNWNNKTDYDDQLKACAVCKCLNRAQVHFPLDVLQKSDTQEFQMQYPSYCWKKL